MRIATIQSISTAGLLALGFACGVSRSSPQVPDLGELMLLQKVRHTKLWLAGQAENWRLSAYEIEELGEGFETIVSNHPLNAGAPVSPKDAIPHMVTEPLAELRDAVQRRDARLFTEQYDVLTAACNGCHQASNVGFTHVQRPDANPYPNQLFSPH